MKAVIDDKIPYIKGQIERLIDQTVYLKGSDIGPNDVADADILVVRTRTHCNEALLKGSQVRLIVTATIGHDHLARQSVGFFQQLLHNPCQYVLCFEETG